MQACWISLRVLSAGRCTTLSSSSILRRRSGSASSLLRKITHTNQFTPENTIRQTMTGIIDLTSDDDVKSSNEPINVSTDSEEDEDLKLAIALSLSEQNNDTDHQNSSLNDTKEADEPKISTLTGGLLGLDRKAMEAERLARLKRKREADGEPKISSAQDPTSMSRTVSPPPIRRPRFSTPSPSSSQPSRAPSERPSQPSAPGSSSKGTTFLRPKILLTSTASNNPDGVSLTKLLTPPSPDLTLKSALLSSFIADFDWLLPHFNTRRTSFVLVLHAHNAQHRQLLQADFDGLKNVRLIMPECLGGSGNMHSKLMLLFFKRNNTESGIKGGEVCRLVIPSANLTPADWGVGGIMENIAFVVDLPVKTESSRNPKKFETELKKQLYAMEVPADVIRKIESLDFRATENFGFVHSMSLSRTLQTTSKASSVKNGGIDHFLSGANIDSREIEPPPTSDADDLTRTGLLSLSDTVSSLGLSVHASDPAYPPRVDYITSSLGNLSMDFIRQFYDAVCGTLDPGMLRAGAKSKSLRSAIQTDNAPFDSVIKQNLRIYFPTEETVRNSKGGPSSAGTICFSKKWWETNDLIRECLCDCIGARQDGILMHNKVCVCFSSHDLFSTFRQFSGAFLWAAIVHILPFRAFSLLGPSLPLPGVFCMSCLLLHNPLVVPCFSY